MALSAPGAEATYAGENGKIAFYRSTGCFDRAIYTIDPDGTDETRITAPGNNEWNPAWSPDGQRIAFESEPSGSCLNPEIYVMNADGSGRTRLTFNSHHDGSPTWSPDGTKIAFVSQGPPDDACGVRQDDIWTMNSDGTAPTQVTNDFGNEMDLRWSPDGQRISYQAFFVFWDPDNDCENTNMGDGLFLLHVPSSSVGQVDTLLRGVDWSPDSKQWVSGYSGDVFVTPTPFAGFEENVTNTPSVYESSPSLSPDGTKLAYNADGNLTIADADGGDPVQIATATGDPHWQPVHTPSTYVRPKGATPMYLSLVPAFEPCSAANGTHGPPLAFGSCNPPHPESPNVTAGVGDGSPALARSVGFVRMNVLPGTPGPPDDTDVGIRFSLTNVMNASDLSEYTHSLRASIGVRVTDKEQTFPAVSSTTRDFPLEWTVPCAATADPGVASHCALDTTIEALVPGGAAEGTRAVWALERLRVYDAGPDGRIDLEDDNSLFATQGIFVP